MDENQRKINKLCGVSDQDFSKYSEGIPNEDTVLEDIVAKSGIIDENQRQINRLCGIGNAVFLKYAWGLHSDDPQEQIKAKAVIDVFHSAGNKVFATFKNQPEKWSGIINECQRKINELMGVSDEVYLRYALKSEEKRAPQIDEAQRKINDMMGVSDEVFLKYNKERS